MDVSDRGRTAVLHGERDLQSDIQLIISGNCPAHMAF